MSADEAEVDELVNDIHDLVIDLRFMLSSILTRETKHWWVNNPPDDLFRKSALIHEKIGELLTITGDNY